jgi:DnaJ-class molecular chaperone
MSKCYYETLEVSRDATYRDIKKSYRKLVIKYHPDRNGDTDFYNNKIKEINLAYECLSDTKKRTAYDNGVKENNRTASSQYTNPYAEASYNKIYSVEVTLEEVFHGCKKKITVLDVFGQDYIYTVEIPAGVDGNNTLVVTGNDRVPEFYIKVFNTQHSFYTRRGSDLYCKVTIPYIKILTGGSVDIVWFDGTRTLDIKPTAYSGMIITIPGMGMPWIGSGDKRGSLYITLQVQGTVDFSSVLQKEFAY